MLIDSVTMLRVSNVYLAFQVLMDNLAVDFCCGLSWLSCG